MAYLVYVKETTRLANVGKKDHFATERAAKAAITRALKWGWIHDRDEVAIAECRDFYDNIEKQEEIEFINPHSGEKCKVTQSVNTPRCCDPRSELYWTM